MAGWGNAPVEFCRTFALDRPGDAAELVGREASLLAFGAGRSYGDAALNPAGLALTERLDCFRAMDMARGVVTVEAGVTLRDILAAMVPRGWFLPVLPGTQYVSVGGAIAANVHGKNQYRLGEFSRHALGFTLVLASGETVEVSPGCDLWNATLGGLGMTGIVESVTLQLLPITSARMEVEHSECASLEAMLAQFEEKKDSSEYMVGWIDHFGRGDALGRGIFEAARHATAADGSLVDYRPIQTKLSVPVFLPPFTLNRWNMALYNKLRFYRAMREPKQTVGFNHFFHPLDGLAQWNRLYGKRGLLQYQCLVPDGAALRPILEAMQRAGQFSFLAVLKKHGGGDGLLGFSRPGYSLALDFANTPAVRALLERVDQMVIAAGGRVYLAKDARLSRGAFETMYADALPEWRRILKEVDPQNRFMSSMARRLGFKEAA